jgi:hypothetical protein
MFNTFSSPSPTMIQRTMALNQETDPAFAMALDDEGD